MILFLFFDEGTAMVETRLSLDQRWHSYMPAVVQFLPQAPPKGVEGSKCDL